MKDLIIIGAGGFGRSIYHIAKESLGFDKEFRIKGFLDDNLNALNNFKNYPPILGNITTYEILENDVFVCSVGSMKPKMDVIKRIESRGGKFHTLIHSTAQISDNITIGNGSVISRNAIIGSDLKIGNHVLIQAASVIGHDSSIGEFVRIDCHVVCVGGTVLEDEVTIHTSAVINHKVVVGRGAVVGAGSFVIRKVKEYTTVYGNPARKL